MPNSNQISQQILFYQSSLIAQANQTDDRRKAAAWTLEEEDSGRVEGSASGRRAGEELEPVYGRIDDDWESGH